MTPETTFLLGFGAGVAFILLVLVIGWIEYMMERL